MNQTTGSFCWRSAALISVAGIACGPADAPAQEPAPPPNLVLVLIDTLRPDHLELDGYERETAPFLAELASRSTVFERAHSTSSWTAPSTASVFTGLYPSQHGVFMGFRAQSNSLEDAEEAGESSVELVALPPVPTLPERLRAAGYVTYGVASNVNIGSELGFDRGFDAFEKLYLAPAEDLVARALEWHAARPVDRPCFFYLHFNDVHKPYEPRAPWYEEREKAMEDEVARYDSEISYLDEWLKRLHDGMGWDDDTVVLVVSDHGEEFGDHGRTGHKFTLYRELNRVLTILHAPGLAALPGRVAGNVSLVDVLPTLLDAAGVEAPADAPGRSLLALARESETEARAERMLFAHRVRGKDTEPIHERSPLWAVVRGRWKLIRNDRDDTLELFDLEADPRELENLVEERPDVADELGARLAEFEQSAVRYRGDSVQVELDAELLGHLRDLGYAGDDE